MLQPLRKNPRRLKIGYVCPLIDVPGMIDFSGKSFISLEESLTQIWQLKHAASQPPSRKQIFKELIQKYGRRMIKKRKEEEMDNGHMGELNAETPGDESWTMKESSALAFILEVRYHELFDVRLLSKAEIEKVLTDGHNAPSVADLDILIVPSVLQLGHFKTAAEWSAL
jgi:hypothetical protein